MFIHFLSINGLPPDITKVIQTEDDSETVINLHNHIYNINSCDSILTKGLNKNLIDPLFDELRLYEDNRNFIIGNENMYSIFRNIMKNMEKIQKSLNDISYIDSIQDNSSTSKSKSISNSKSDAIFIQNPGKTQNTQQQQQQLKQLKEKRKKNKNKFNNIEKMADFIQNKPSTYSNYAYNFDNDIDIQPQIDIHNDIYSNVQNEPELEINNYQLNDKKIKFKKRQPLLKNAQYTPGTIVYFYNTILKKYVMIYDANLANQLINCQYFTELDECFNYHVNNLSQINDILKDKINDIIRHKQLEISDLEMLLMEINSFYEPVSLAEDGNNQFNNNFKKVMPWKKKQNIHRRPPEVMVKFLEPKNRSQNIHETNNINNVNINNSKNDIPTSLNRETEINNYDVNSSYDDYITEEMNYTDNEINEPSNVVESAQTLLEKLKNRNYRNRNNNNNINRNINRVGLNREEDIEIDTSDLYLPNGDINNTAVNLLTKKNKKRNKLRNNSNDIDVDVNKMMYSMVAEFLTKKCSRGMNTKVYCKPLYHSCHEYCLSNYPDLLIELSETKLNALVKKFNFNIKNDKNGDYWVNMKILS